MDTDIILAELHKLQNMTLLAAKEALTMDDASALSGLSKSYLYKMVSRRQIPFYKSQSGNKVTYFSREDLTRWLLHHRIKTNDEMATEAVTYVVTGKNGRK